MLDPSVVERSPEAAGLRDERSMLVLEYAVSILALGAVLLLAALR